MTNSYYPHGSASEQSLYDSLITETIFIKGEEFFYIPRKLVAPDEVLTEDMLSKFVGAYPIDGYLDNVDAWGGAGSFMSKFGVYVEEQATITISKTKWETLVGIHGETTIPTRPCEGDLLWLPTTQSILEIRFVENQSQFYQLHKQFVYKLKVELFTFSSERFETGIPEVDNASLERTFNIFDRNIVGEENGEFVQEDGSPLVTEYSPERKFDQGGIFKDEADKILDFSETNPFGDIER